jgi:hypothetical protein
MRVRCGDERAFQFPGRRRSVPISRSTRAVREQLANLLV